MPSPRHYDLVTGGAGFIGSHLVRRLVDIGRAVRVVDDLSTGDVERLRPYADAIDLVRADLATADLGPVVAGVERVFHLAAVPSVPRSVKDPFKTHQATLTATLRLLIAARDDGVERFVFSSSSSIYGDARVSPKHEDLPLAPISPYGIAKAAAERYTSIFGTLYGLPTVSLRYFNVFGPSQDPRSQYAAVVPLFVRAALDGRPLTIIGDGSQTRDFTYVDNVIDANLAAASGAAPPGGVYNIAAGSPHSVLELAKAVVRLTGREVPLEHLPARPGDIRHSHADISRASADLGWLPVIDFEEGLRRTVEWYRGA